MTTEFEIKYIFSDTYNPQQNAMIERFDKTLKMAVYWYIIQWNLTKINNKDLQKIVTNYNNTLHITYQIPAKTHTGDDITKKYKVQDQSPGGQTPHDNRKFSKLCIGDMVRVARRTIGE
jgi:hypothetical protein